MQGLPGEVASDLQRCCSPIQQNRFARLNQFSRSLSEAMFLGRGPIASDLERRQRLADIGGPATGPSNLTVSVKKLQIAPQGGFASFSCLGEGLKP